MFMFWAVGDVYVVDDVTYVVDDLPYVVDELP